MSAVLAPARPLDVAAGVPHNIPVVLSSFVGRAREVAELTQVLARARLVTVVGPGGAGKTRLARAVAERAATVGLESAPFPDGVWWVELGPVGAGADVGTTIAAALDVRPSPGNPVATALEEALRGRRLLLVLDNCEHVVDDAAALAEALLRSAPGLTVLATSREALAVEGEIAWPVPPLGRPPAAPGPLEPPLGVEAVAAFEAVQLFVERARAATPGFALTAQSAPAVASICAQLDGLPLALELAAAILPVLGVEALAARLDDALSLLARGRRTALPRHRTLRAVLDWSYALLTDDERALLRRLSVFRGAFAVDAVEAVCAPPERLPRRTDVMLTLGRLVEHSLVEMRETDGEARYRLLETVRQYGASLLRGTPDEREVRMRHAEWVARTAAEAEPLLFGPTRGRTVERLRQGVDEIRAALAWATGPDGDAMLAVRIAGPLGWFWFSGVPWQEARALLGATLAAVDAEGVADAARPLADRVALGTLFYPVEGLAYFAGDTTTILATGARQLALWDSVAADEAALTPAQQLAHLRGRALCEQLTGLALGMRGEYATGVPHLDRSLQVAQRSGDAWLLAVLTMRRALLHLIGRRHELADADYRAAEPALRALGERWFLSLTYEGLSTNAMTLGDVAAATRHAREGVRVLRDEPDPWFISRALDALAIALARRACPDDARLAARLHGAAGALRRRCGVAVLGNDRERHAAALAALRTRLDDAFDGELAAGEALALAEVLALVDAVALDPVALDAGAGDAADRAPAPPAAVLAAPTAPAASAAGTAAEVQAAGGETPSPQVLRLEVLGPFVVGLDGQPLPADALPTGKVRELLLFLLLHERAGKDEVGLALWPDASPAQVRNAFHVTLHHLRRLLGDVRWVTFARNTYRLERAPAPDMVLDADVDAVLAAAAEVRQAARRQSPLPATALDDVRAGLARLRGDLAQGLAVDDWILPHQDRVRAAWADGMDALARAYVAVGRQADAVATCEALVAREPLREGAHRLLMEALAALGEPARALAHYDALTALLAREVGTRPARETQALVARLRG